MEDSSHSSDDDAVKATDPADQKDHNEIAAASRPQRTVSRRDVILAGTVGLVGVATGIVGTVVTTYVQERARTALATSELRVFTDIAWTFNGHWRFNSAVPIDLTTQPNGTLDNYSEELTSFLLERGCIRVSPLVMVLHLSRPGDSAAIVRGVSLIDHKSYQPDFESSYLHDGAGGSNNTVLAINLDNPRPRFVTTTSSEMLQVEKISNKPDAFTESTFSIAPHLTESITLAFHTSKLVHEFKLRLDYFVEGVEHRLDIDFEGNSFRVSPGGQDVKQYCVPWYEHNLKIVPCA